VRLPCTEESSAGKLQQLIPGLYVFSNVTPAAPGAGVRAPAELSMMAPEEDSLGLSGSSGVSSVGTAALLALGAAVEASDSAPAAAAGSGASSSASGSATGSGHEAAAQMEADTASEDAEDLETLLIEMGLGGRDDGSNGDQDLSRKRRSVFAASAVGGGSTELLSADISSGIGEQQGSDDDGSEEDASAASDQQQPMGHTEYRRPDRRKTICD